MGDRLGVISAILGILGFPLAIIAMFSREGKAKSHKVTFGLIAAGLIAACVTLLAIKYIPARGMTGAAKPPARPAPSSLDRVLREGRVSVGAEPFAITADDAGVWVANREANSVSQLDPKANRLLHTISVGSKYSVIPWVGLAPRPGVRWRLGRLDGPGWLWRARRGWWR